MIARAARRAPHTGDAKLSTAAFVIVVRAVKLSPRMTSANLYTPTVRFGVLERCFYLLLWMN
jgi:hypothetical protein